MVTRVAILVFTIFAFAFALVGKDTSLLLSLGLLLAIGFQVSHLIKVVEKPSQDVSYFLDSIKFDDLSSSFKTDSPDLAVQKLHKEMKLACRHIIQKQVG